VSDASTTIYRGSRSPSIRFARLVTVVVVVCLTAACFKSAVPAPVASPPLFPLQVTWSAALGAPMAVPPTYTETSAYVPLRDGRVVSVDLGSGAVRWTASVAAIASPAAGNGLALVATADAIEAFQEADGKPAWRLPLDRRVTAPLFTQSGWLIAALEGGTLAAVRVADGHEMWRRELGAAVQTAPAAEGDHLFVSIADGRVAAIAVQTGQPVWQRRLNGPPARPLAVVDRLFVGSADNFFYSIDRRDGDIKWRWRTGADIVGTAALDERQVYFASLDNVLRALDRFNGVQRWRIGLPLRPFTGPLLLGDILVVSGLSPTLNAFHTKDGSGAGEFTAEAEIVAPPHLVSDSTGAGLIILTEDGDLQRLGHSVDPPLRPLRRLPGRQLRPEPPPEALESPSF
jgi:outer membrane protein assembly factor BamB